ncbi:hypothetical protein [Kitasatospora sp. NBC_01539]|uniref:hypothetical protein n=1 Tax=Kitasatospora sp. NBC_01539 TaxID=2903577 RepID=UPI0038601E6E
MGQPRFLIVSRPATADPQRDTTVWRLLGANNRHLGQSGEDFTSVPACLHAIEQLRRGLDRGRPSIGSVQHGQQWRWRLEVDGRTVACSTRAYRRQRECQYNLARFLAGARCVDDGPLGRPAPVVRLRGGGA